ncbi:MAG: isoprenylcysteine carboxylmethyltransferase family protein [Bacteroidetes bacterium]|nr:isoprenylcysteine carboxylmethyltransferase family protein [Bacteroidota bacterium]
MNERSKVGENAKSWDKKILGISALIYLLNVILAGLDAGRFQWSPTFNWSFYATGIILSIAGQIIFLTARNQNNYFSSIVRIQTDREHKVCDTGLYKIVRHPGYLGMTISLLSVPFITGSIWSFVTTFIAVILLFIRTYLEDKMLMDELKGYKEYAEKTKYKLIPKIW